MKKKVSIKGTIWITQGRKRGGQKVKMHLYDIFSTKKEAILIAQYHKKSDKSRYFIIEYEHGFLLPYKMYALYLDNIKTKASL